MKFRDYIKESFGTAAAVAMTIMAGGGKKGGVSVVDLNNSIIKKNLAEIKDLEGWIKNHQEKYLKGDFNADVKKGAQAAIDLWQMNIKAFQKDIDKRKAENKELSKSKK
jgi:hypothetical protein